MISPYVSPGIADVIHIEERYSIEKIVNAVCDYKQMPLSVINGKCRKDNIVYVRHLAYYMIWITGAYSLEAIGRYFKRDHTVIRYGANSVVVQLTRKDNILYKHDVKYLLQKLDIEPNKSIVSNY